MLRAVEAMPLRPSLAESYRDERETYVRERLKLAFQALKCLSAQGCFPAKHKVIWPDAYDRNARHRRGACRLGRDRA
jgi:hypothetical protein